MTATDATDHPDHAHPPDVTTLREQIRRHCGFDPGVISAEASLDQLRVTGLARLRLVVGLETTYQVELPADLISAIDTVDELLWFVGVKLEQRAAP
jgi:acyl carrier protein